jgi:hypothetical protein
MMDSGNSQRVWDVSAETPVRLEGWEIYETRLSLFYLGSYLRLIGLGLLFVRGETLKLLQSIVDYGDVFSRLPEC